MCSNLDIHLFNQRDEKEFEKVFKKHYPQILSFCYNILQNKPDAEDATQNAFIELCLGHEHFESEINIEKYLFFVARNKCIDILRKSMHHEHYVKTMLHANDYYGHWKHAEVVTDLHRDIRLLEPLAAKVTISYLQGNTHKEIAGETNISVSTVKRYKEKAEDILKQLRNDRYIVITILLVLASICAAQW